MPGPATVIMVNSPKKGHCYLVGQNDLLLIKILPGERHGVYPVRLIRRKVRLTEPKPVIKFNNKRNHMNRMNEFIAENMNKNLFPVLSERNKRDILFSVGKDFEVGMLGNFRPCFWAPFYQIRHHLFYFIGHSRMYLRMSIRNKMTQLYIFLLWHKDK